uniref:Uncharacterized protein n=1 Tax=Avena sativa TaxID=4498 RepID=A0ACD5VBK5_AVESA
MLRLRSYIAARLLSSTSAAPTSPLHRLLSAAAAAPAVSPKNPSFAVEQYLVDTCGLTQLQALKASTKLSHLKSPSKPDAVLAILAGLGLSTTDVASLIAKDPLLLVAGVDTTLTPNVAGLTALGLSRSEVARLVMHHPSNFRLRSIVSKMHYYLPIFGSFHSFLRALNRGSYLLSCDLERAVKPNIAFLLECRLAVCDIAKLCTSTPRVLLTNPEHVQAMVACAEGFGVPRGSGMFRHMLHGVAFLSQEQIAVKLEYLKKTFRWSDAEVRVAVLSSPELLRKSKESLQLRSEFFFSEVGLEPAYIARRPVIINYSLEGRLRPRYYVVKYLKENGLIDRDRDYYNAVVLAEKVFVEKYICHHKEAAPHLAEDYATACRGEVPTRFRFA